jgi:hypothetical protein
VPDDQAKAAVAASYGLEFQGINKAVINFTRVVNYTGFNAEYAWVDDDLVIHFFMPPEATSSTSPRVAPASTWLKWWTETFARCLDETAREFFSADYPRLVAKYTEELASWWFRAHGYGSVLVPDVFALEFLRRLDVAIDKAQAL